MRTRSLSLTVALIGATLLVITTDAVTSSSRAQQAKGGGATAPPASREAVYADIQAAFGFVPGFLKSLPDNSLELEWKTLKAVQMEPGAIPNKYRELIGLAVAAAKGCEYCTYFHTQFARLNGATDAELEDAVHFAKSNMGWSTYLHGMQYDFDQFKHDVDAICDHARMVSASK